MNQDESNEQPEKPPAEQPAAVGPNPAPLQPDNRFRGRSRRPSRGGRRDNRGGDRDSRGPRSDRSSGQEGGQARGADRRPPAGNIGQAIDQVEHIRLELNKVLSEINEVLETLEIAEREKTASEQEIDKLRESLRALHRDPGYPRNRNFSSPPSRPSYSPEPPPVSPVTGESEEQRSEDTDD